MPVSNPVPNLAGRFGAFGGRYVPETLTRALDELVVAYNEARGDPSFQAQLHQLYADYVGRPSPLYHAERLSRQGGGAQHRRA
jgi:tryptophan synthase beta chain